MRFLPIVVLAAWPCSAFAQGTLAEVQKAAQALPEGEVSATDLGLPAQPGVPKTAALTASWIADSAPSEFDTDKIAGNAEVLPPLAMRQKAPGLRPEGVATADLGQPAQDAGPKDADIAVSHADGSRSIYDEDKIAGNEPPPAPLADRQKAPSYVESSAVPADLGIPANPETPKTADLAASYADSVPSVYDDDKIAGNEESYDTGPLADRQKYPSELIEGTDPAAFGLPATVAPKEADLAISKAEDSVPSVEDNDKIAGNPYVEPPLLPRQKLPSTLPDPVIDADMGQPTTAAPKQDLAVSKAVDGQPSVEDYDKIVGNPVVSPPLTPREKLPAFEPAIAGLSAEDLGQPAVPAAEKTASTEISKAQDSYTTEYDEDKIAGNSDLGGTDSYDDYETYDPPPPPELTAKVRALLDDPATRASMLQGIGNRGMAPPSVKMAFEAFVAQLFDAAEVRDLMAEDIARVFMDLGLEPDNPAALGRVVAEYMAAFGAAEVALGMGRLPVADQRAYLTGLSDVAESLPAAQCGPFLEGAMDPLQQRKLLLTALDSAPEDEQTRILAAQAAAILGHVKDNPPMVPMTDAEAVTARQNVGADAFAAIDALDNNTSLLAAFGDPFSASAEDSCTVHRLIIKAALANTGPDADLGVRYLVANGWQN